MGDKAPQFGQAKIMSLRGRKTASAGRVTPKLGIALSLVVLAGSVSVLGTYVAPRFSDFILANSSIIADPLTLADELHNQSIHDARKRLGFQ